MEDVESLLNITVVWRGNKYVVEMSPDATVKNLGDELCKLTDVKQDTMRLIVPETLKKASKLFSPFSNEHSLLSLQKASIVEGKTIRMMGVSENEVDNILQNAKVDFRIAGFDEEERRMKQRASYRPNPSLKLPQGPYIFCDFCTLQLPGIELNPPAPAALRIMHKLAADPGIVAIMNKHRWRVGIMTEMAPVGYVGVSPKCILGFNKNQGEEISLRLRTDDLKGFRKYESIKKTLLHELAHMIYTEHDANFWALNKQLNQEAVSLDWTKSGGHTLNGARDLDDYDEEYYFSDNKSSSQKLGGSASHQLASARASSVAAAHRRLVNPVSISGVTGEPDPDDSESNVKLDKPDAIDYEPDPDEHSHNFEYEPFSDLSQNNGHQVVESQNNIFQLTKTMDEPDPDDLKENQGNLADGNIHMGFKEPDPDESEVNRVLQAESALNGVLTSKAISNVRTAESVTMDEPDPDESGVEQSNTGDGNIQWPQKNEAYKDPDPDEISETRIVQAEPGPGDILESSQASSMMIDESDPNNEELQRIQDPVTVICDRLQKAVETLRVELNPTEATAVLQTLFKIICNVIEHPNEMKFKKLRKTNPIIQKNVVNHRAAMEILQMIGFTEEVVVEITGKQETYLALKRNDPGLLWLAKSALEAYAAS